MENLKFNFELFSSIYVLKKLNGTVIKISREVPASFFEMELVTDGVFYNPKENKYYKKKFDLIPETRTKELLVQEEYYEVTEFFLENKKLNHELHVDALTGIPNVTAAREKEEEISIFNQPSVIAMCDINDFKGINDTYGHGMGDKVLKQISKTLQSSIRSNKDMVARIGGDEFIFYFETSNVEAILEKLSLLEIQTESLGEKLGVPISVSIGAAYIPQNEIIPKISKEIISLKKHEADQALYYVKNHVKYTDKVGFYNSETQEVELYSVTEKAISKQKTIKENK